MKKLIAGALCLIASSGCFSPSEEAVARLEHTKAEAKLMDQALDGVEDRLLGNQAKIQLWRELGDRHREVTQVACTNSAFHLTQMVALREQQGEKARRLRNGEMVTF